MRRAVRRENRVASVTQPYNSESFVEYIATPSAFQSPPEPNGTAPRLATGLRVKWSPRQITLTAVPGCGSMKHVRFGGLIAKRWPVVLGLLLVTAMVALVWRGPGQAPNPRKPQPLYNGEPLAFWLSRDSVIITQGIGSQWPPASLLSDSNAVRRLVKAVDRGGWLLREFYGRRLWPKLPFWLSMRLPLPRDDDPIIRMNAARCLGQMGPAAKLAVPALIEALAQDEDSSVRAAAAIALAALGNGDKAAVLALSRALNTETNYLVRSSSSSALLRLDPEAAGRAGVKMPSP